MSGVKETKVPICNWCGHMIITGERAVKFACPGCGEVTIWRCWKCRQFGRPYKCPKCGFKGP